MSYSSSRSEPGKDSSGKMKKSYSNNHGALLGMVEMEREQTDEIQPVPKHAVRSALSQKQSGLTITGKYFSQLI